mmetsp:Transcript_28561/g.43192  ORF Transcript_28561/g.43192 Transcript_28561/m.43192 type:complete len:84 (-) Transcript_28561:6-257(-)
MLSAMVSRQRGSTWQGQSQAAWGAPSYNSDEQPSSSMDAAPDDERAMTMMTQPVPVAASAAHSAKQNLKRGSSRHRAHSGAVP